jgi:CSLREA domain-containing protein
VRKYEYWLSWPIGRGPLSPKYLVCALCAAFFLLALPSISAAATLTVTTPVDQTNETSCLGVETCSLRDAIRVANSTQGEDTIDFAASGEGTIELANQLPAITAPLTIAGASAPGYEGRPVIAVNGRQTYETGLWVRGPGEATIDGLAIGGFHYAVFLEGSESEICSSWIGLGLDEESLGGSIGIKVSSGSSGNQIGVECGENFAPDVIGGNSAWGIEDEGLETEVENTRVGITQGGAEASNVAGGIWLKEAGHGAEIGGGPRPNVIAYNGNTEVNSGAGILVETPGSQVAIRGNSIFANAGLGIEVLPEEGQAPPEATLESVTPVNGDEVQVTGTLIGNDGEKVALDLFANEACDEGGAGEGKTYLGSGEVVGTGLPAPFSTDIQTTIPARETVVTATATGVTEHATSEFSNCVDYVPGPRTLTVNTLVDGSNPGECTATCSLRDAIETSNLTEAEDTIDFSVQGTIAVEESSLPEIESPVLIDGTTAPGFAGTPTVLLDGTELPGGESRDEGLVVGFGGEGTVISGLAIGGFEYGVYFHSEEGSQICASYIGVEPDGATRLANRIGLESSGGSEGGPPEDEFGAGCGSLGGNLVSGNEEFGIIDFSGNTRIAGNRIGLDAAGSPLPNGWNPREEEEEDEGVEAAAEEGNPGIGAGIVEDPDFGGTVIGGVGDAANPPNEIAYNDGPGILISSGADQVTIRGNLIFSNEGKGIEIIEERPVTPTIESVAGSDGSLTIKGQTTGAEIEPVALDFFASALCVPGLTGEGERFLGSTEVEGEPGGVSYQASVPASTTADQPFVTVTATGGASDRTSEFSECFRYAPPEPEHEETKQPETTHTTPPKTEEPTPTNGESVIVVPKEGTILIKLPGSGKYVPLEELKEIPVGAIIDATKGKVTLTSIGPNGEEQTAVFFGGIFKVKQKEGSNVVVLEIIVNKICRGGMVKKGGTSATASSVATASAAGGKKGGKLWGSGHGSFKTEGHAG